MLQAGFRQPSITVPCDPMQAAARLLRHFRGARLAARSPRPAASPWSALRANSTARLLDLSRWMPRRTAEKRRDSPPGA
jgi:hypothetical protein